MILVQKALDGTYPQVSEYHQGHRLMGPARGAFSPGAMWASSGWGFNGWTIKKAEFLMGYLVEYYEHFMGEQPSQPDFCPSWVTWKCWESGENPMLSTGKSGFPLFLGIIPNFYTCIVSGLVVNGYKYWHRMGYRVFWKVVALQTIGFPKIPNFWQQFNAYMIISWVSGNTWIHIWICPVKI